MKCFGEDTISLNWSSKLVFPNTKTDYRMTSTKLAKKELPNVCPSKKTTKNCQKVIKINFFRTLELTKGLQQSRKHLIKKSL